MVDTVSVAPAAFPDPLRTHEVRRRVLQAEVDCLNSRAAVSGAPHSLDAAARSRRLTALLEHDQLDW